MGALRLTYEETIKSQEISKEDDSEEESDSSVESTDHEEIDIVFIDDDEQLIEIFKSTFGHTHKCLFFNSATEALEKIPELEVKVIVTDLVMPGLRGTSIVDWVYKQKLNIPVICISSQPEKEDLIKMVQCRVFYFLEKPFEVKKLRKVILRAFLNWMVFEYKRKNSYFTVLEVNESNEVYHFNC